MVETARDEAGQTLSYETHTWNILRAIGVDDTQLIQLLQPTGGLFPSDQQQYRTLQVALRRMGHILENNPGNVAQQLRR